MTRKRPGDVLAGRYRLDDLLSETGQGRFWRAWDQVLFRPVAIHVIDSDDERAVQLTAAARASARVVEPRLLRVLDVENDGRICYVVNEWGQGTSLDHLLAGGGPLPPRRAAWIVDEVAMALENAHEHGVAHGRLNPENVLIDTTGSVRLIGFAVEAALYGLDSDRVGIDVVDLAGLLHFGLTGKWPGLSESAVPRSPREQHGLEYRVLRPRQIRAGVPRVLDDLVDEVLNRPHGRHAGPNTAHEIHEVLARYVGDRTGLSDELAEKPQMTAVGQKPRAKPSEPQPTVAGLPVFDDTGGSGIDAYGPQTTRSETTGSGTTGSGTTGSDTTDRGTTDRGSVDRGTTDRGTTDRGAAGIPGAPGGRADPPAPPPPLEPPPERPLFAPDPADGGPARRARATASPAAAAEPVNDSSSYWPFDAEPEDGPVPGRRWLRLGFALGALLLLVIGAIVVAQLRDGDTNRPAPGRSSSPSVSPSPTLTARPITGLVATDFDPLGTPPAENSDLTPRAVDGNPATSWRTSTYRQNLGPGGIKSGVGLILDLRAAHRVTEVDLTFAKAGTGVSVYVSASAPRSVGDLGTPVAKVTASTSSRVPIEPPASGRFVTLWFTSLPQVDGGFRAELAEASVVGTPAAG